MPINHPPPAPTYVGPADKDSGEGNKPIHRIVIHSTVSPCVPGGARNIAAYFRSKSANGSAHYVTDPGEVVQVAWDDVVCWHAPPNSNSLGIEMCDIPGPVPSDKPWTARWKALRRVWRWAKPNQRKMLKRTARLTAELALAYNVPLIFRKNAAQRGVTTHAIVSKTFKQSTHWDPGWWPRRKFMRIAKRHAKKLIAQRRK